VLEIDRFMDNSMRRIEKVVEFEELAANLNIDMKFSSGLSG
jgi:hypothetical protein